MTEIDVPEATVATAGQLLARHIGLRLNPSATGRLTRSVVEEAVAQDLDVSAYAARLENDAALLQGLIDRVTVQETSFFRDLGQLEGFRDVVLPGLSPPVRIWSAGCSNGQEPYTLALILAEAGVSDWEVIATDVSTGALERTGRARYSAKELERVPDALRARYFRRAHAEWEVAPELRQRVRLARQNLVADPPPFEPGQCSVVFCRNVLIYLDQHAMVSTIERMARWLRPPAWLFLGYSESLWQITDVFELTRVGDAFAYRLRPNEATAPAAASSPAISSLPPAGRSSGRQPGSGTSKAVPPRRARATRRQPQARPPVSADGSELLISGLEAMNAGDFGPAVIAFRKYAYLEPDQPAAHLHLGLALEAAGDGAAARRAFAAARGALDHVDHAQLKVTLDGYRVDELARMLDAKLAAR